MEIEWDSSQSPDMRGGYDFIDGVRGKYADGFARGSNVVVLDPDVAAEFNTQSRQRAPCPAQERTRASGDDG